jgi:hypothetical protein
MFCFDIHHSGMSSGHLGKKQIGIVTTPFDPKASLTAHQC